MTKHKTKYKNLFQNFEVGRPAKRYTLAQLYRASGDLKRQWYVYWRYTDRKSGEVKRGREYLSLKWSALEREVAAQKLIREVNDLLRANNGFMSKIVAPDTQPPRQPDYLRDILQAAHQMKLMEVGAGSRPSYDIAFNNFAGWLRGAGLDKVRPADYTTRHCYQYLKFLAADNLRGPKRINYLRTVIQSVFTKAIEIGDLSINPFLPIRRLDTDPVEANLPYSDLQARTLRKAYEVVQPSLNIFSALIYYLLARPTEISNLKAADVDFHARTVKLHTKGNKKRYAPLSDPLAAILERAGIHKLGQDAYLFDDDLNPGRRRELISKARTNKVNIRHRAAKRWAMKEKNVRFEAAHTMYSWKATGARNLYDATKDIRLVQALAGHASVASTEAYLKNIGVVLHQTNDAIMKAQAGF